MSEPEELDSRLDLDGHLRFRGNDERRTKKPPPWVIPFLRALERTGDVRASAEDAGIDHTTAYLRRRTHENFASDWEEALKAHAERVEREREKELQSFDGLRTSGVQP